MRRVIQFTVLFGVLLSAPAALTAQGIKFREIKPGTEYHYKGDSVRFYARYVGTEHGEHVIQNFFSRNDKLYQIERYDSAGRLVQIESLGFKHRHVFTPFHCRYSEARRCAHKMTLYKDGKRAWAQTKQYEIRGSGKTQTVIKNANSNRLKTRYTFDAHRMITSKHQKSSQFADNWELVKKRVPVN